MRRCSSSYSFFCLHMFSFEVNLLSMTLSVEHFDAIHSKTVLMTQLEYARSFSNTMKESFKRLSSWSAYYFTSQKTPYYPPAESDVKYHALALPSATDINPYIKYLFYTYVHRLNKRIHRGFNLHSTSVIYLIRYHQYTIRMLVST